MRVHRSIGLDDGQVSPMSLRNQNFFETILANLKGKPVDLFRRTIQQCYCPCFPDNDVIRLVTSIKVQYPQSKLFPDFSTMDGLDENFDTVESHIDSKLLVHDLLSKFEEKPRMKAIPTVSVDRETSPNVRRQPKCRVSLKRTVNRISTLKVFRENAN